jgi:hypothetical protein
VGGTTDQLAALERLQRAGDARRLDVEQIGQVLHPQSRLATKRQQDSGLGVVVTVLRQPAVDRDPDFVAEDDKVDGEWSAGLVGIDSQAQP